MKPMFWETIQLSQKRMKYELKKFKLTGLEINLDRTALPAGIAVVGIDPGIHFGITIFAQGWAEVLWGNLPREKSLAGLEAIDLMWDLFHHSSGKFSELTSHCIGSDSLQFYIEGPSYNDRVGQPLLEQVRFGFAVGAYDLGHRAIYLPPMTARKLAFGSGKIKGNEIWININQNGADSIGLALAGVVYIHDHMGK